MKIYSHDYTLPAKVSGLLYRAYHESRRGRTQEAEALILYSRELLDEYLSSDNMVPDDDCEDGWVRQRDIEGHEIYNDH